MLQEGSCQLKSTKDTIDPNESPQHLLMSDLSVQTRDIRGIEEGVCAEKRHTIKMQLIFLRIIFSYVFLITRSVLRSEVSGILRFSQREKKKTQPNKKKHKHSGIVLSEQNFGF